MVEVGVDSPLEMDTMEGCGEGAEGVEKRAVEGCVAGANMGS